MINNSHKKYLILSFLFLLFSFFFFFFLYKGIKDNYMAYKQAGIDFGIELKRQEESKTLDDLLKTTTNERALLDSHFAKSYDVVPFLDTLEQLASKVSTKAEVYAVEQKIDAVEGAKPNLVVGIKVLGSFESIYRFVTLLENVSYELEILSMVIEKMPSSQFVDGEFRAPDWSGVLRVKLISFVP